jgi:hypothetical protein
MAITKRSELEAAIATWLVRSDLSALIPQFITFGEMKLNRKLRLLQQEIATPSTVTLSQNSTTAALPTNFLKPISLVWADVEGGPSLRTTQQIRASVSSSPSRPSLFAVSSVFVFERPADQAYSLKSTHFEKWALGSGADDTNWLLQNASDAYLYASLEAGGVYTRKSPSGVSWGAELKTVIGMLNDADGESRAETPLVVDAALTGGRGGYDINRG